MKIGIQTWGSYGDIRPFLALSEGLQTAGHDVTLVTTRVDRNDHDAYRSQSGVTISPVASPVIADKKAFQATENAIFRESNRSGRTNQINMRINHIAPILAALVVSGCATIGTLAENETKNKIYSGTIRHAELKCAHGVCLDFPFSLFADTLVLPITIPWTLVMFARSGTQNPNDGANSSDPWVGTGAKRPPD